MTIEKDSNLVLRQGVVVTVMQDDSVIINARGRAYRIPGASRYVGAFQMLQEGGGIDQLDRFLPKESIPGFVRALSQRDLLRQSFTNRHIGSAQERQVELFGEFVENPSFTQSILDNLTVAVLGVGGTGGVAIQHLLGAGVRNFICVDHDRVERSNFNRQYCFIRSDEGCQKTSAIERYIEERGAGAKSKSVNKCIREVSDLDDLFKDENPDIILCCADKPAIGIKEAVLKYCLAHSVPCTFGSVGIGNGIFGPLLVSSEPTATFLEYLVRIRQNAYLARTISGSMGWSNSLIATVMVADVLRHFTGIGVPLSLNATVSFDFATYQCRTINRWD